MVFPDFSPLSLITLQFPDFSRFSSEWSPWLYCKMLHQWRFVTPLHQWHPSNDVLQTIDPVWMYAVIMPFTNVEWQWLYRIRDRDPSRRAGSQSRKSLKAADMTTWQQWQQRREWHRRQRSCRETQHELPVCTNAGTRETSCGWQWLRSIKLNTRQYTECYDVSLKKR